MEEEVVSGVYTVIITLVAVGIVITVAIIATQKFGVQQSEVGTVDASGVIVIVSQPVLQNCQGGRTLSATVNITDPQRRSFQVIPFLSFSGGESFGFAAQQNVVPVTVGPHTFSVMSVTDGKGSAEVQFSRGRFPLNVDNPFPATATLHARIGFWIWTGESGCLGRFINDMKWSESDLITILTYTGTKCADTYIAIVDKDIVNNCVTAPSSAPSNECNQQPGHTCQFVCPEGTVETTDYTCPLQMKCCFLPVY